MKLKLLITLVGALVTFSGPVQAGSMFDVRNLIAYFGGNATGQPTFYLGGFKRGQKEPTCIVDIVTLGGGPSGAGTVGGVRIYVGHKDTKNATFVLTWQSNNSSFYKSRNAMEATNETYTLRVKSLKTVDQVSVLEGDTVVAKCSLKGDERIQGYEAA